MNQIIDHLLKSKHVLLATHINPDGDALGSLIAMGLSVAALNKDVTLYNENPLPAVYRFLPSINRIVHHTDAMDSYDTAVILDCGDLERMGSFIQRWPGCRSLSILTTMSPTPASETLNLLTRRPVRQPRLFTA